MARWNRTKSEFKPDAVHGTFLKTLRMTRQQRLRFSKWLCYVLLLIVSVVVQDVILSRFRFFGATPELVVALILLMTVVEGTEVGSLFVLIASVIYYYTGTAPGAYCIGYLCFLGIFATMLRQMYLNRNRGAIVMCAGAAAILYEVCIFATGIFQGLTRWSKLPVFLLAGVYNLLIMIPLYPLICKIGTIGGNTWKE